MQMPSARRWIGSPSPIGVAAALAIAAPLVLAACDIGVGPDTVSTEAAAVSMTSNFSNSSGAHATVSTTGSIDSSNAFFQSLGTNGRACVTCHDASTAWSITPASVQARFNATNGTDPIFRLNDGANAPNLPVATVAQRKSAYSMLLNRGVIRVGLPIPANAEFDLVAVDDPYRYASANELSLFRRPLPTTNLSFLSAVMWDGRETVAGATMAQNLARQANDATLGHAQAAVALTAAQQSSIVAFETALFTAQTSDSVVGSLSASPATGGPTFLSKQAFFIGINDPLGGNPQGTAFTSAAFSLYNGWTNFERHQRDGREEGVDRARPGHLQQPPDPHRGRRRAQRQARHRHAQRHLHHLPRRAQRRRPLGGAAARHRPDWRRTSASAISRCTRCRTRPPARPSRPPTPAAR